MNFINLTTIENDATLTVSVSLGNLLYFRANVNTALVGINSFLLFAGGIVLNVVETEGEILTLLGTPVAGIAPAGAGASVATPSI